MYNWYDVQTNRLVELGALNELTARSLPLDVPSAEPGPELLARLASDSQLRGVTLQGARVQYVYVRALQDAAARLAHLRELDT